MFGSELGMETFRVFLLGQLFVVESDHRALELLDKLKENNMQLTRSSLFMTLEFDIILGLEGMLMHFLVLYQTSLTLEMEGERSVKNIRTGFVFRQCYYSFISF